MCSVKCWCVSIFDVSMRKTFDVLMDSGELVMLLRLCCFNHPPNTHSHLNLDFKRKVMSGKTSKSHSFLLERDKIRQGRDQFFCVTRCLHTHVSLTPTDHWEIVRSSQKRSCGSRTEFTALSGFKRFHMPTRCGVGGSGGLGACKRVKPVGQNVRFSRSAVSVTIHCVSWYGTVVLDVLCF
jgi:hypothetical protein